MKNKIFIYQKSLLILLLGFLLYPINFNQAKADENQIVRAVLCNWIEEGKSQREIADLLDVDASTISRFINKKTTSSPRIIQRFKEKFPREYEYFMDSQKLKTKKGLPTQNHKQSSIDRKFKVEVEKRPYKISHTQIKQFIPNQPISETKSFSNMNLKSEFIREVKVKSNLSPKLSLSDHKENLNKGEVLYELSLRPSFIKAKVLRKRSDITLKSPVVISYRDEGDGKGAFYDHYTIQKATNYPTCISHSPKMKINSLKSHIKNLTYNLKFGKQFEGRNIPEVISNSFEGGLLVIPGRMRKNEDDLIRTPYEKILIKEALKRGQPILAICAGSWQLWQSFEGTTREVEEHNYGGGMIRLGTEGKINYNIQIHRINIEEDSLLSKIIKANSHEKLTVNSVHWKAPDESMIPLFLDISARAIHDGDIAPNSRTGKGQMKVESDSIEAFETKYGTPVIGVQWHPEAYDYNNSPEIVVQKQRSILRYMAQAGDSYYVKRKMLKEFEEAIN